MSESIEITRRFSNGRVVTVKCTDENSLDKAIESEKKHQDDKYERAIHGNTRSIMEAFTDLCNSLEWN